MLESRFHGKIIFDVIGDKNWIVIDSIGQFSEIPVKTEEISRVTMELVKVSGQRGIV